MSKPVISDQELFDTVARHLLTQKKRSISCSIFSQDYSPSCAYRGDDGLKCAIGVLIPDNKYKPSLEGKAVVEVEVLDCLPFKPTEKQLDMLQGLQSLHDMNPPGKWMSGLEKQATYRNLDTALLREFE